MKNTNLKKVIILIVILGVSVGVYHNLPIGIRHILNTMISSDDLYEPITLDEYKFYKKGYSKEFEINPSYIDYYEIGMIRKNEIIPSTYKFGGKLRAEFFYKDKLIYQEITENIKAAYYAGKSLDYFKQISLMNFEIPLGGEYKNDIRVKLTMLEPDIASEKYKDDLRVYIRVSATP